MQKDGDKKEVAVQARRRELNTIGYDR